MLLKSLMGRCPKNRHIRAFSDDPSYILERNPTAIRTNVRFLVIYIIEHSFSIIKYFLFLFNYMI